MSYVAFWHTFGMARFAGLGFCGFVAHCARFVLVVVGLAVGWNGAVAIAQDTSVPTLHVYADLMQIPVLVLTSYRAPITPPVAANRFSVSIDSGPRFRPTHVRPEGNDPISLAILLDTSGPEDELLSKIDEAIASLAPLSLLPQDHISIYALDCSLTRSLNDASVRQVDLKRAVDLVLEPWTYRKKNKHAPRCQQSAHLWDALSFIVQNLYHLPGRRVILALTNGSDKGSRNPWNETRLFAQASGVAIFGLAYRDPYFRLYQGAGYEDAFNSVCELSGGMVFTTNERFAPQTLKQFVGMLRGRYIVEFPRPSNSTAGEHDFLVTIDRSDAFIRPAGISVPIADPALLADPTTVKPDPLRAPVEGARGVLTKPK
jgi:hypothetical protein